LSLAKDADFVYKDYYSENTTTFIEKKEKYLYFLGEGVHKIKKRKWNKLFQKPLNKEETFHTQPVPSLLKNKK
jgi:hypothetical protein